MEVSLRPVYGSRFRGEPPGGWPATVPLGFVAPLPLSGNPGNPGSPGSKNHPAAAALRQLRQHPPPSQPSSPSSPLTLLTQPGFAAATATAGAFGSSIFVALAFVFSQCFSFTVIPTSSMEPTLMPGDVVIQDRLFTGTALGRGAFPPGQ